MSQAFHNIRSTDHGLSNFVLAKNHLILHFSDIVPSFKHVHSSYIDTGTVSAPSAPHEHFLHELCHIAVETQPEIFEILSMCLHFAK